MDFEPELSEKFHNLPGSIVPEKKKSLNAFISELNDKIPQETIKNAFVKNLTPQDKLETVFKVDLLLHYQIYDEVLELLKSGNSLYISMILKDWNFFKKTFQNMSGNAFVHDVLSHVSFSTRIKIINRVSKNLSGTEKADEFLEAVEERYGISSAEIMLAFCSFDVIKAKVEKYNLQLKYKQLITILNRDSQFLEFYFAHHDVDDDTEDSDRGRYGTHRRDKKDMLKAIYKHNEQLFHKLCEKYSIKVRFGKHLSKKVLKDKEYLLKDLKNCNVEFKRRQLYRQLRKNPEIFKQFVLERTADDINVFLDDYMDKNFSEIGSLIYRNISEGRRYQFLNGFFKEKFGLDLHDKPELISEYILRLMPEKLRENVLDAKIKENSKLVYIYRPDTSVPFILDKIKHCSDRKKRVSYVSLLYKTCRFHKSEAHLLDIMKYVETRHRNDTSALETFMDGLNSWENIENLSVEHWTYILRIRKLIKLKRPDTFAHEECAFLEKHIIHLLNNNLDASEELRNLREFVVGPERVDDFFKKSPKYRRYFILKMKEFIDKMEDGKAKDALLLRYLNWVYNYNKSTASKDDIPILRDLPLVQKFVKVKPCLVEDLITFYVRLHYEHFNPIIWKYPEIFLEKRSLFSWYLLHHEDELLNHFGLLFYLERVKDNEKFIRYLPLYSFRNIPERLTQSSIETIHADVTLDEKLTSLNHLALINQEEFLRLSELYYPDAGGKINADEPPDRTKLQEGFLKSLNHLNTSSELLQVIIKFCVGDYLKYALKSLYSIVCRIPEKEGMAFLKKLHRSAVSVRKHTIHLGKFIFPLDAYTDFLVEESVSEKNASIKNILFRKALGCAKLTEAPRIWELIKATMNGIDKDDVEAHDLLVQITQVPKKYRAVYIPEAYAKLDTSMISDIRKKKFDLMVNIPEEVVDQLDCNLLQTFITQIIFDDRYTLRSCWKKFVFHSTGEKQNFIFDFALGKLKEYNIEKPNDTLDDNQSNFMDDVCEAFLEFRPNYSKVSKFASMWFSKFPPEIDIDRHFHLTFIATYAECLYDVKCFTAKIHELLGTYPDCLELFTKSLRHFLDCVNSLDVCEFVEALLTAQDSITACLLSIRLLKLQDLKDKREALRYNCILQKLKERPELSIKIYYRKYLYYFEKDIREKLK